MKKFLLCFLLFDLICCTSFCFVEINSIEDNNSFLSYSTPEEQGLSSKKLDEMLNYIDRTNAGINSIIIVRNNYIVFEEYPNLGVTNETMHELHSVTKSFTSALIGI
ncbi:MAG: hypothetical protein FK731_02885, partial [Asgard group archaeon]|nr:hypothetical protein [Asgard group archaeon]